MSLVIIIMPDVINGDALEIFNEANYLGVQGLECGILNLIPSLQLSDHQFRVEIQNYFLNIEPGCLFKSGECSYILGTVIGIIHSFDMLGRAGIQDPQAVTSGIAQALITTAAGLLIAIFTLFPYNYFMSKVEKAAIRMEKYATSLEIVRGGDQEK